MKKLSDLRDWIYKYPKQVYGLSMGAIIISFSINLFRDIYYPPKIEQTMFPTFYSKSDNVIQKIETNEKKIIKILEEIKVFQEKAKNQELTKKDSVRIEYLYNEYIKLKNE